jgi:hypothetical protein
VRKPAWFGKVLKVLTAASTSIRLHDGKHHATLRRSQQREGGGAARADGRVHMIFWQAGGLTEGHAFCSFNNIQ